MVTTVISNMVNCTNCSAEMIYTTIIYYIYIIYLHEIYFISDFCYFSLYFHWEVTFSFYPYACKPYEKYEGLTPPATSSLSFLLCFCSDRTSIFITIAKWSLGTYWYWMALTMERHWGGRMIELLANGLHQTIVSISRLIKRLIHLSFDFPLFLD